MRGETTIQVPYSDGILRVAYPFFGPANAKTLREPTSRDLALFAEAIFESWEREEKETADIMKKSYFRAFTGILYEPETKQAYFIENPEFDENSVVSKKDLLSRIGESHTQVPFEKVHNENVPWKNVAKHPYIIAWAGEEGAEKLAELASKHPTREARIYVPNISDIVEPTANVATFTSGRYVGVDRLVVNGDDWGSYFGLAFGVRGTEGAIHSEATRKTLAQTL